jgi:asparagine synthase (glutamine-hydrolysing)
LIDIDLLDFVCRIPQELRINKKLEILMFNRACSELAKIPWAYSRLPVSISTSRLIRLQRALYRLRKELTLRTYGIIRAPSRIEQANWPVWFRSTLRPWLEKVLLGKRTISRGYMNPKGIHRLLKQHMSKRFDHSIQLSLLLTFELWNRVFIDGDKI